MAMKISFTTLSCPLWGWEKILDEASGIGFDGIEVRGVEGEMYLPKAPVFLPGNIRATIAGLKRRKLEVCCLGTSVRFHDYASYNSCITEGKESIDLACKLGVPYIRIFGDRLTSGGREGSAGEVLDRIVAGLDTLGNYCNGKNVKVLLETHGDFNCAESLRPVFNRISSHNAGILWDIEHTFRFYGDEAGGFFSEFKDIILHTHIKDARKSLTDAGEKSYSLCLTGEGDIPIGRIIDMLAGNGYKGWLSLEWEKKWHPELEEPEVAVPGYFKYIKRIINP